MGTSKLFAYEMQDTVWDKFDHSNDHIVPYPIDETRNLYVDQSDSCKRPWDGDEELRSTKLTKKDPVLDKGSWSCTPTGAHQPPYNEDTSKEVITFPSKDTMMANQDFKGNIESGTEFSSGGGILKESCSGGNNIYDYPMSHIPQTDSQINFFENDDDGLEGSGLLYYGWPDIGNFEEVDQMFRSCDSTFGRENLPNEEEACWFQSSYNNGGTGAAINSCESSGQKGIYEASKLGDACNSISNSKSKNSTMSNSTVCQTSEVETVSDEKGNLHKHGNISGGKNGHHLHPGYSPENLVDTRHLSGDSSVTYSPSSIKQHKDNEPSLSFTSKQENPLHQHSSFCHHPASQVSVFPSVSSGLSENSGNPSPSAKESSYSSKHMFAVDSGQELPYNFPTLRNQNTGKLYRQEGLHASLNRDYKHTDFAESNSKSNKQSCHQMPPHEFENEIEGHSGVEGTGTVFTGETESTNALDSSLTGFAQGETTLEAKSFHQLQQVMEKLDIRTKLCIRDGLYRLARSAKKRHACENLIGSIRRDREVKQALAAEDTDKCTEFMDMETNTNPIDRSIAHLLFHGPSNPAIMAGDSDAYS